MPISCPFTYSWTMTVTLRTLTEQDEKAFMEGMQHWDKENIRWYSFAWQDGMTYPEMLEILRKENAGIDLRPNRVPHTMLYGFLNNEIIGRVSIRHELNDYLKQRGGHIGYAVAKPYRKKGYATEMVRQGLEYCKSLGLESIMITCSDDNEASWKIVEKFGGLMQDRVWDDEDNEVIRRYWIYFKETP